ncbi:MAG: trypsin-like peptidase domain-containing protein [Streptosporangiaceae bacterium]|nr:trypsin-like peptidase domain-containing protein [Streptosporangiaceae bacterium]MBV9856733.1 trypsin-like peptidase domain-containing protein [Streptosporangiaceae bacterium]
MHDDGPGHAVGDGRPPRSGGRSPLLPALVIILVTALGAAAVLTLQRLASGPARAGPASQGTARSGTRSDGTGDDGTGKNATGNGGPGKNASGNGGPGRSGPGDNAGGRVNERAAYGRILPSIVDVTSTLRYANQTAEGTGFVISANEALVLTNNHVVRGATTVTATLARTGRIYTARIVGVDVADDVALLQLRGPGGLAAARMGNSARLAPGTPVLAVGNRAGQGGSPAIAPGAISGLNRTIRATDANSSFTETLHNMLQTTAQIAPGDSGGPLVNSAGQVIGMNTATGTGGAPGAGVAGYAIPINAALSTARLIAAGHAGPGIIIGVPGFLGVLLPASTSPDPRRQAQDQAGRTGGGASLAKGVRNGARERARCLSTDDATGAPPVIAPARSGALIDGVLCGTAAAAAGIAAGDVITGLGGRTVTSPAALSGLLNSRRPGAAVAVAWVSVSGTRHTARVRLDAAPAR